MFVFSLRKEGQDKTCDVLRRNSCVKNTKHDDKEKNNKNKDGGSGMLKCGAKNSRKIKLLTGYLYKNNINAIIRFIWKNVTDISHVLC